MNIIGFLLIGLVAGWLAGKIMKGKGFGFIGNLVVGVIGALVGGFLVDVFNIDVGGLIGQLAMSVVGAVIFLWIVNLIKKK